ncbi:hypothetical protein NONO_c60220 [Nocardia nova SH22a]|uniref:HTH cro/C1-type domain-containing protein n=1 Tax=Nocardia nova SH22a TaxID=1415166 RepID=W5TPC8_9NOCA|nr:helix-turn-helix transcriptional regulator [Nocardia nova]AHH20798.1 hypothetical protein NONO_c60220 [Nocardia nova SH22a]
MRWRRRKTTPEQANEITVQETLMAARIMNGITRAELASRWGVTVEQVMAFERGETDPRLSEIRRYAHAARALASWTLTGLTIEPNHEEGGAR